MYAHNYPHLPLSTSAAGVAKDEGYERGSTVSIARRSVCLSV